MLVLCSVALSIAGYLPLNKPVVTLPVSIIQEEICHHAIALKKEEGWQHARTISDAGYSGKDRDRPVMTEALADINAGLYDVVVVYKLDRVSRSLVKSYDFCQMYEFVKMFGHV